MSDPGLAEMQRRVRVLWAIKGLGRGGAEVLLERTAQRIERSKFEVSCVYVDGRFNTVRSTLEQSCVGVTCLGDERHSLLWIVRLFRFVRRGDFDIVHAHSPLVAAVTRLAVRSNRSMNRPRHITTEHCMRSTYHVLTRIATRLTSRLDDHTVAVSLAVMESLGRPRPGKTSLAYQGIDVEATRQTSRVPNPSDTSRSEFKLLCVANLRRQKGFKTLFEAMKFLDDWDVPFVLDIAGLGGTSESAEIEHIPSQIGLSSKVRFLGSRSDMFAQMRQHDLLVASSNYEAGQIVAFEAAAVGLPIVSTKVGLMTELFTNGTDCLLADIGDSRALAENIRRLWLNPDESARLARNALDLVRQFDFARTVQSLEQLYLLTTSSSCHENHQ